MFLKINDILFLKADSNYTNIHMTDGKNLLVSRTLKDIENHLPEHLFERSDRGTLINLDYVTQIISNDEIILHGKTLDLSCRRVSNIVNKIMQLR